MIRYVKDIATECRKIMKTLQNSFKEILELQTALDKPGQFPTQEQLQVAEVQSASFNDLVAKMRKKLGAAQTFLNSMVED